METRCCRQCGSVMTDLGVRKTRAYCSRYCRRRANNLIARYGTRAGPATPYKVGDTRPCEHCGVQFRLDTRRRRFCSDKCRFASWGAVHRKKRAGAGTIPGPREGDASVKES